MVINIDTEKCKNPELAATAAGMVSEDYKERFIAEYVQLVNRIEGLDAMLLKWDIGTLPFTPPCSRDTYNSQIHAMKDYAHYLNVRAKIEGIALP